MGDKSESNVLFDSEREIPYSDYVEWCEANDIAPGREDSDAYWRYVGECLAEDLYAFREGGIRDEFYPMVATIDARLWHGHVSGGTVVRDVDELLGVFRTCDRVKIYQDESGLHMDAYHHDGTNRAVLRAINGRGKSFLERNEGIICNSELANKLAKPCCSIPLPVGKDIV